MFEVPCCSSERRRNNKQRVIGEEHHKSLFFAHLIIRIGSLRERIRFETSIFGEQPRRPKQWAGAGRVPVCQAIVLASCSEDLF